VEHHVGHADGQDEIADGDHLMLRSDRDPVIQDDQVVGRPLEVVTVAGHGEQMGPGGHDPGFDHGPVLHRHAVIDGQDGQVGRHADGHHAHPHQEGVAGQHDQEAGRAEEHGQVGGRSVQDAVGRHLKAEAGHQQDPPAEPVAGQVARSSSGQQAEDETGGHRHHREVHPDRRYRCASGRGGDGPIPSVGLRPVAPERNAPNPGWAQWARGGMMEGLWTPTI
jgi:hypothetical protein